MDRRLPGQRYPRLAVRGRELNRLQVAAALFEAERLLETSPTTEELFAAVDWAVEMYGTALDDVARELLHLSVAEDHNYDVAQAWERAHALVASAWYTNATSRLMTRWERAVALHLAGEELFPRRVLAEYYAEKLPAAEVSRLVSIGAAKVSVAELESLARELEREQNPFGDRPATAEQRERRAALKRALPDHNRRRFCFKVAQLHWLDSDLSTPLVVRTDSGERFLGAVVADCPEMFIRKQAIRAAGAAFRKAREGRNNRNGGQA
ncbi:hypothetical protein [Kitasatospora griseola]